MPAPIADRTGGLFSILNGRPAALTERVQGRPVTQPQSLHCAAVGAELGGLHRASLAFRGRISNKRGPAWILSTSRAVRPFLAPEQNALIEAELKFQRERRQTRLPNGAIHADLFRDNVLFEAGQLGGFIDFYFAGFDCLQFDIAVCVNDWCIVREGEATGALLDSEVLEFLAAYNAVRPLLPAERAAWNVMLRAAALRFWLSRLFDFHRPRSGPMITPHDPGHFQRILQMRRSVAAPWLAGEIPSRS